MVLDHFVLREDGSVITWGNADYAGDSSSVADELSGDIDVIEIIPALFSYSAIREDGSVISWGMRNYKNSWNSENSYEYTELGDIYSPFGIDSSTGEVYL